jgi:hypothetical protein
LRPTANAATRRASVRRRQVESTSIAAIGHEDGVLEVEFRNGGVYRYHGVPKAVFARLLAAESKGRFFNRRVRDAYRCERVRAAPVPVQETDPAGSGRA